MDISNVRCTLKATRPLFTDKVAKVLTAKNNLYQKELSYVCKKLDKERSIQTAAIEDTKRTLMKTLGEKNPFHVGRKKPSDDIDFADPRNRSCSLPSSPRMLQRRATLQVVRNLRENGDETDQVLSRAIEIPGKHRRATMIRDDMNSKSMSPNSQTSTLFENDVFERLKSLSMEHSEKSPSSNGSDVDVPNILITSVDDDEDSSFDSRTDKRLSRMSLVRSYSTGDLKKPRNECPTISFPDKKERARLNSGNSEYEVCVNKGPPARCGSLDEMIFNMNGVRSEKNIPHRPRARSKPYSEEPFYLRKKCLVKRCLKDSKDCHRSAPDGLETYSDEDEQLRETPLSTLLPPIALPSIYMQECTKDNINNKKVENGKMIKMQQKNAVNITADVSNLTKDLSNCRYLRNK